MKNVKRFISLAIGAAMTLGSLLPVNAGTMSANKIYVSHFEDFSGWTSAQGSNADLPDGFCAFDAAAHPTRAQATGTYVDTSVGTRAFKLGSGAMIGYQFDRVYKTGVRRISFDVKMSTAFNNAESDGSKTLEMYGVENTGNDNPYDWWKAQTNNGDTVNWDNRPYASIKLGDFYEVQQNTWKNTQGTTTQPFNDLKWHKTEVLFDYDKGTITYYTDGVQVGTNNDKNADKVFYFINTTGTDVYIDNFAVFHGANAEYADAAQMKLDGYGGLVAQNGGKVQIDLSRVLTDKNLSASDFTVKNSGGDVVSGVITKAEALSDRKSTMVLTLGEIPNGVYTLEYKNAANSVEFTVGESKTVSDYDTEQYYYMNEDFSGYVGGVAPQWQATQSSARVPSVGNDSVKGNTLKMSSGAVSSYMNKFETFQSGKLNVEFDIKTSGKGWGIGFIREADSAAEDYEKHLAIGNIAEDGESSDIYTCSKSTEPGLTLKQDSATIDNTDWNHISITVDMTSEKYDFEITKADNTKETFSASYPYHKTWKTLWYDVVKTGTDEVQDSYKCGLNGIRLYSDGTSDVEFDNIKIYSDNSNYISENFDNYTGHYTKSNGSEDFYGLPAGYFRVNDLYNPIKTSFTHTEGRNYNTETNAADKGAKINGVEDRTRIRLAQPITDIKNNGFVVEFDLKKNDSDRPLGLALYPKEKFYGLSSSAPSLWDGGVYEDPIIRVSGSTLRYGSGRWGGTKEFVDSSAQPLSLIADNWNHIKIEFDPKNGVTAYLGEGNNITKSNIVSAGSVAQYWRLMSEWNNIYGIGIGLEKKSGEDWKTLPGDDVDNFKIYGLNNVTKPSVTNANAINVDGGKTVLKDGINEISNLTKAIEIKFSEPLNETAETLTNKITLSDINGTTLATGELSEDKMIYKLTLNTIPDDNSYAMLKMSSDIKGQNSAAQLTNPVSAALKFKGGMGKVEISDMQLFKKIDGRSFTASGVERTSPTVWVPATSKTDSDAAEYKIVISGTNTTGAVDDTTYNYINGIYDTVDNADVLRGVEMNKLSVPNEIKFSIEKAVPTTSGTQTWRSFIWTDDYKPVVDMIK